MSAPHSTRPKPSDCLEDSGKHKMQSARGQLAAAQAAAHATLAVSYQAQGA